MKIVTFTATIAGVSDRPARARAEGVAERIGLRAALTCFFDGVLEKILKAEKESLPLLRRHEVQNDARNDEQKEEPS